MFTKNPTDWFNARQACLRYGGDLLEITSPEIDDEVADLLAELKMDKGSHKIWIGLYKGQWQWEDCKFKHTSGYNMVNQKIRKDNSVSGVSRHDKTWK